MKQAAKLARVRTTGRQAVLGNKKPGELPAPVVRELSEAERTAEAGASEATVLIERLALEYVRRVENYVEYSQGMVDPGDGHKLTQREIHERAALDAQGCTGWLAERARKASPRRIEWKELGALAEEDTAEGLAKWEEVKQAARDEITSGFRAADISGESLSPFDRARFLALHEQLEEGWQPRNGVEHSLVDMLAQTLSLFQYWTQIAHARAVGASSELYEEDRKLPGCWPRPKQDAADAIEQAQRLADGYHRQYMRTLRQMRDLRRYAPAVIVNNGGQVNVATDGGQQVNLSS
jgi:hypothetical protein